MTEWRVCGASDLPIKNGAWDKSAAEKILGDDLTGDIHGNVAVAPLKRSACHPDGYAPGSNIDTQMLSSTQSSSGAGRPDLT